MRLFLKEGRPYGWYSGRNKWGKLRVNQGKKVRLRKGMGRGRKKKRGINVKKMGWLLFQYTMSGSIIIYYNLVQVSNI